MQKSKSVSAAGNLTMGKRRRKKEQLAVSAQTESKRVKRESDDLTLQHCKDPLATSLNNAG